MGVNVKAVFAAGTRIRDVATVASILLGAKPIKSEFDTGYYAKAVGYRFKPDSHLPTMPSIILSLNKENPVAFALIHTDGGSNDEYHLDYHYEAGPRGETLIMPKSTAAKIALSKALIKFFGGEIDYNDCDDVEVNYRSPRKKDISAQDGEPWYSLQDRILALEPLTIKDMEAVEKFAAY